YETGTTSLAIDSANFAGLSQITINDNFDVTYIDGERIDTGNLRLSGNTLTTIDGQLEISPATSLFNTNTNPALVLSNGLNNDRTNVTGSIRYNTETSLFEGYSTANLSFGGSYSDDRQTSIAAHDTDNSLIFTANGTTTSTLTSSTLTLNGLSSGDILFNNSLVTTTDTNSNLDLRANGTGKLSIYDININDKNIINTSNNNLVIASTGLGYIKFDSTTGLVVPFGTTAQRSVAPILGETRWNQDENYLETYNSENEWQRSAGLEGEVNEDTIRELVDLYIMVLG
ncbi:hypothetical protein OAA64_01330, partial [bacterium]|nr:hypothetical protein [bacterium]